MSNGREHTVWKIPPEHRESPVRRATGRRIAFGQAVYARRSALGWCTAELARRSGMSARDIERIEESGVDPTLELIEQLATALKSVARITPGTRPEFRFEESAT
ncbi:helix-turn-helix domain-containing protein [Streptomyces albicerus]|uniref:helix-turn-helix domain-containing protein n=1 Tax=Streptomyces albicerus TaxID=2569859 RepID=UPI001788B417|nr:helix-turn-helix transcriptional regulator [Streptomyces albicerus]